MWRNWSYRLTIPIVIVNAYFTLYIFDTKDFRKKCCKQIIERSMRKYEILHYVFRLCSRFPSIHCFFLSAVYLKWILEKICSKFIPRYWEKAIFVLYRNSAMGWKTFINNVQANFHILDHPSRVQVFPILLTWSVQLGVTIHAFLYLWIYGHSLENRRYSKFIIEFRMHVAIYF